jgi:hypothetical protein
MSVRQWVEAAMTAVVVHAVIRVDDGRKSQEQIRRGKL